MALAATALLSSAPTALAQAIECGQFNPGSQRVTFQFTKTFTRSSAATTRVTIFRMPSGAPAPGGVPQPQVLASGTPTPGQDELTNTMAIALPPGTTLTAGELYLIYVDGVEFGGKPFKLTAEFKAATRCGEPEAEESPEGREDANVYVAGTLSTSSGGGLHGTIDAKLRRQIYQTDTLKNPDPSVISDVGLMFDLKASGDPEADPDSLNLGVEWQMDLRRANDKGPLNYLFHNLYPKLEAERDFGNVNAVLDHNLKFGLRRPVPKTWAPVITPFIGQEIGKNLQSPVDAAEGGSIYRLKAGTFLNLFFEPAMKGLQKIEIDAEYTRRWPLRRELSFEEDDNGDLKLLEISKRPRDYVRANLNFMFRDDFGASVGYEFGELPPSFKLVDHKLKIGLVYKTK
jgi:hypothetical protein